MNAKAAKHIKRVADLEAEKQGITSDIGKRRLYKDIKKVYQSVKVR